MSPLVFCLVIGSAIALSIAEEPTCSRDGDCGDSIDKLDEHDLVERLLDQAKTYSTDLEDLKKLLAIKDRLISIQRKEEDYLPRRKSYKEAVEQINKLAKEKFEVNGIAGEVVEGIGLGLVTTKDIKSGDTIMKIPADAVISTQRSIERFECMGTIKIDKPKYSGLWKSVNLSLFVLAEGYNDSSPFRTYMNSLPSRFTHPIFFTIEEFEALTDASLVYEGSAHTICETMAMYAKIWLKLWETKGCAEKIGFDLSKFTVKAFQWAYTMSLSRNYDGSFHEGEVNKVMIPFWDLANHDAAQAVETSNDPIGEKSEKSNGVYHTYAERDIKKGEKIFMHYLRPLDPIEAFSTWGFVYVKSYYLTIDLDLNDPNYPNMKSELKKAYDWSDGLALPDPGDKGSDRLLDFHNKKAIRILLQIANGDPNVEYTPKSIVKAWKFLQNQLEQRIAQYDTTIPELREKLQAAKTENMKLIYGELIAEIEILNRLVKYVISTLDN